jgi:hypothetical protein
MAQSIKIRCPNRERHAVLPCRDSAVGLGEGAHQRGEMHQVKPNLADVTGDGKADLVHYVDGGTPRVLVFASTGRSAASGPATWYNTQHEATAAWASTSFVTGDIDGDGRDDLVALKTSVDSKPIRLYTIRSTGTAYETPVLRYTSGPDGM